MGPGLDIKYRDRHTHTYTDTHIHTYEVRAFHGIVNQANYAFCKSDAMQPFRHLLSSSAPFEWTKELSDKFEEAKGAIVDAVKEGVEAFTMDRPTILAVDWSKHGVGYMLLQKTCECEGVESHTCCQTGWKLILAGGRFTSPAESRYSPVEGEALAIVEGLEGTKDYTLGMRNLVVATDHKPLPM